MSKYGPTELSEFDNLNIVELQKQDMPLMILKGAFTYEKTYVDDVTKEEFYQAYSTYDPHYLIITNIKKLPVYIIERDITRKAIYLKYFYRKIPDEINYNDPAWPEF